MNIKTTFPFLLFLTGFFTCTSVTAQHKKHEGPVKFGREINVSQVMQEGGILKCGSTEYENFLQATIPGRASTAEFEAWLAEKKMELQQRNSSQNSSNVITIPVVVHVVHNNRPYGTQENILDEQVFSQIEVLNQDFRRMMGTPGFNDNPVGADVEIEFCLAQRDPQGNPTNGINRISQAPPVFGWSPTNIDNNLKPQTIWNPDKYFNIWVVNNISFFGIIQILGFAQFPQNSGLPGLFGGTTTASTDGIVIGHRYFGSSVIFPGGTYAPGYDRGRTTTHETGHWLGLRHIWGDTSECFDDGDFCDDTPPATAANEICEPNFSCDAFNMIENYMDYTPDTCTNIFTQDQKTRMITVMNFASRRASLLNSDACIPPQTFAFDAGVSIVSTNVSDCEPKATPQIRLENEGSDVAITSVALSYNFSGNFEQTLEWSGLLEPGQHVLVDLNETTLPVGNQLFNVSIVSVNGEQDDFLLNNSRTLPLIINDAQSFNTNQVTLNLVLDNYPDETTWEFRNSSGTVVFTGGPYTTNGETINQTFDVVEDECYIFTIFDDFGDGICCGFGQGSYTLTTVQGTVIAAGGSFADADQVRFNVTGDLSVVNPNRSIEVVLYPNPVYDILQVRLNTLESPKGYEVYNALGQKLLKQTLSGSQEFEVNTTSLPQGVYFIKIAVEDTFVTKQFVKK